MDKTKNLKDRKMMIAYQRFYLIVSDAIKDLEDALSKYYGKEIPKSNLVRFPKSDNK